MRRSKLVRDRIPELFGQDGPGTLLAVRQLEDAEYLQALIEKLREETEEFAADLSPDELADIIEVIRALAILITTAQDLEQVREAKAAARGTFANRIWMTWEDDGG